jgi:plasmid stabilization system protein ParE
LNVSVSRRAAEDLAAAINYLAERNPRAAAALVEEFMTLSERLAERAFGGPLRDPRRTGLDPESLELELTESVPMKNSDPGLKGLRTLRENGRCLHLKGPTGAGHGVFRARRRGLMFTPSTRWLVARHSISGSRQGVGDAMAQVTRTSVLFDGLSAEVQPTS